MDVLIKVNDKKRSPRRCTANAIRHSRQEKNPTCAEKRRIRPDARRRVCAWNGNHDWRLDWRIVKAEAVAKHDCGYRRRVHVFDAEINADEGEVVAGFARRQPFRRMLPAHMAQFTAAIRIIRAKAYYTVAAGCDERQTQDGSYRHPAFCPSFFLHGRKIYHISPSWSRGTKKMRAVRGYRPQGFQPN